LLEVMNGNAGSMNGNIPTKSTWIIEYIVSGFLQAYRVEKVIQIHWSISLF
jgi:hypothetical protein